MSRQPTTELWTGDELISVRASSEFKEVVNLAARHEHRTVSGFVRRALMYYLVEGGYFEMAGLDEGGRLASEMVSAAEEELRARK